MAASLSLAACRFSIDPDSARFSCDKDADCGAGQECRPQAGGGRGRCFPAGQCAAVDTCDGVDSDCNGVVDDRFPEEGQSCDSGAPGVCMPGTRSCASGALKCVPRVAASAETCDGLDNDCDNAVDEDFNLTQDPLHCGSCGAACPAGTSCIDSACRESLCQDSADNDGDGAADCEDTDCLGRSCSPTDATLNCGVLPVALDAGADGGEDGGSDAGLDGGDLDGGEDAGDLDGGPPDAGELDGGADAGPDDAGMDGGEPDGGDLDGGAEDGGVPAPGCFPREADCGDSVDNDGDGWADCADPDCEGQVCGVEASCAAGSCG